MHLLAVEAVTKQFGEKPLFEKVSFGVTLGERIGVIGANGSGKSTLLRIVAGAEAPDEGRVTQRGAARGVYLPQNPAMDPDQTVLDYLFNSDDPRMGLLRDYQAVVRGLDADPLSEQLRTRLQTSTEAIEAANAWDAERQASEILTRLGIADTGQRLGALSGGQRRRVALAAALMQQAELLILDEPTNHLDADTVAWLETFLARSPAAVLLVTHDRYFLDRLVTRLIEVDNGRVFHYDGGYADYLRARAERAETRQADAERYRSIMRKELAWLQRGARARSTKQKARIERIDQFQAEQPVESAAELSFTVRSPQRLGKRVIEAERVSKSFGAQPILRELDLTIGRGDRLGIVGPNGSGKSTLLNLLSGRIAPDSGMIVQGETVRLAYYDQESAGLDERMRVVDFLAEAAELIQSRDGALVTARTMLERFLFPASRQQTLIGSLSGGERRRLYLLRTLVFGPNVLLLDEPTNDLDLPTLAILEDYLDNFEGTLLVASHDRYFLDRTVQQILALEDGAAESYAGDFSMYAEERKRREARRSTDERRQTVAPARPQAQAARPRTLSYKEKRELVELETRIAALEEEQTQLNAAIASGGDFDALRRRSERLAEAAAEIEVAFERWAELSTIAEQ